MNIALKQKTSIQPKPLLYLSGSTTTTVTSKHYEAFFDDVLMKFLLPTVWHFLIRYRFFFARGNKKMLLAGTRAVYRLNIFMCSRGDMEL